MRLNGDFLIRPFGGKMIAVSVSDSGVTKNAFVSMNSSTAFVWELLQDDISYDELLSAMLEKYDADEETIKADLDAFLSQALSSGIIIE